MALLTEALLAAGLDEATIAAVMGGNALRLLREALPAA
jgi:microsomal dipeptidase-like Zn-dependent dipeptidase